MHDPAFVIHDLVCIGKVARQLCIGALDDTGPKAEIALLKRYFRAALFLPQRLTASDDQFRWIGVLQQLDSVRSRRWCCSAPATGANDSTQRSAASMFAFITCFFPP
jgi:hypothetical protein